MHSALKLSHHPSERRSKHGSDNLLQLLDKCQGSLSQVPDGERGWRDSVTNSEVKWKVMSVGYLTLIRQGRRE